MEQNQPLVSVSLLTYNAEKYLENCLASVLKQSYPHLEILIIDNASTDGTVEYLKSFDLTEDKNNLRIIFNKENVGFAAGHNQAIKESKGEFILCLNQDVVLDKDFITEAIKVFKQAEQVAVVQGKLLRKSVDHPDSHQLVGYQVFSAVDTTGLEILKNRRIINRGQGEIDQGQFEKAREIFGADGAAPVYRRKALEDVKLPARLRPAKSGASAGAQNYKRSLKLVRSGGMKASFRSSLTANYNQIKDLDNFGEYFDEDFNMYKEDVDLAWRLQLYGWQAIYQPKSVAWHDRTAGDSAARNYFAIIRERLRIGKFAKYLAFKNQRLMQLKNEQVLLLLKHFPWFLPKETASWFYVLIFERYTWRAIKDLFKQMPRALKKRKVIMARKRIGAKEMEKWFN